jgi:integrase
LDPRVLRALRRWQVRQKEEQLKAGENWQGNEHNLIFTSRVGTPINDGNLRSRIRRLLANAEIEEQYSLKEITRHTFATLIEEHIAAPALERAMGHVVGGVALSEGLTTSRKPYIHRKKAVITEHLEPIGRILDGV